MVAISSLGLGTVWRGGKSHRWGRLDSPPTGQYGQYGLQDGGGEPLLLPKEHLGQPSPFPTKRPLGTHVGEFGMTLPLQGVLNDGLSQRGQDAQPPAFRLRSPPAPSGPQRSAWQVLTSYMGTVNAASDWASQHDHYLYGTPKRPD